VLRDVRLLGPRNDWVASLVGSVAGTGGSVFVHVWDGCVGRLWCRWEGGSFRAAGEDIWVAVLGAGDEDIWTGEDIWVAVLGLRVKIFGWQF
jgi:hypothetical protein